MKKRTRRVVGYVRVSTDRQAESGLSLEAQREQIVSFAVASEYQIVDMFEDAGISGSKGETERPGLQQALETVLTGRADAVIVAKRDRLARDGDLQGYLSTTLDRAGAELIIIDEVDLPPMMKIVLTMVAQVERELAKQRTRIAMQALRARGHHCGNIPFGYVIGEDGKLAEKDGEIEVVKTAVTMRAEGATLREIASWLTERRVPTRRGGRWAPEQVRSMLAQAERRGVRASTATAA